MSIFGFIKNGRKQKLNLMPNSYPSSRVTYNNGNVSDALDGKVSKSGDTMTGRLAIDTNTNNSPSGVVLGGVNSYGQLDMFSYGSNGQFVTVLPTNGMTEHKEIRYPNASGTLALTSDIFNRFGQNTFSYTTGNTSNKTVSIEVSYTEGMLIIFAGVSNTATNALSIITYDTLNSRIFETKLGTYALSPAISNSTITISKPDWAYLYMISTCPITVNVV